MARGLLPSDSCEPTSSPGTHTPKRAQIISCKTKRSWQMLQMVRSCACAPRTGFASSKQNVLIKKKNSRKHSCKRKEEKQQEVWGGESRGPSLIHGHPLGNLQQPHAVWGFVCPIFILYRWVEGLKTCKAFRSRLRPPVPFGVNVRLF